MLRKIVHKGITLVMRKKGYSNYMGPKIAMKILRDYQKNKSVSFKDKLRSYKKGFLSQNLLSYNLNSNNVSDYLEDFNYAKMHPVNGKASKLIDDKLTLKYVLNKYNDYLPEYYFRLEDGRFTPIFEGSGYNGSFRSILDLLEEKGTLALKLISGSLGKGFYKVSLLSENSILVNNERYNLKEFETFLHKLSGYVVTEYIEQHSSLNNINNNSLNTLRIMVIKIYGKSKVKRAFLRFGTKETGLVDNASQGGIFSYLDTNSGVFSDGKREKENIIEDCIYHPDSNLKVVGEVPHWETIKATICEISDFLNEIIYFGYDIAITEDSFKIIEINSHQDINWHQYNSPLLNDADIRCFFKEIEKKGQ